MTEEQIELIQEGQGCARCQGAGSLGRVPSFELLQVTSEMADSLRSGMSGQEVLGRATNLGMWMQPSLYLSRLLLAGEISAGEALRVNEA